MKSNEDPSRREFIKLGAAITAGIGGALLGCDRSPGTLADGAAPDSEALDSSAPDSAPAADLGLDTSPDLVDAAPPPKRPTTTVRERIRGVLPEAAQSASSKKQWGLTKLVAGETHSRTDLLKVDVLAGTSTGKASSMLYAVQLTDLHMIDEESPARTINLDKVTSPSWRHQEAHGAQVLDAMVRKIRQFDKLRAVDCVLLTGDLIDNNQKNELAWLIEILSGGAVTPNSGLVEDPVPGKDNDPHDVFTAAGLGVIPWYAAMGNHDALVQGNLPHGLVFPFSLVTGDPTVGSIPAIALGRVNPPACNPIPADESPTPVRCIPTAPGSLKSGALPPDKDRKHLSRQDWISRVLYSGGSPAGHGLDNSNLTSKNGDYVADPAPGVRLIVLDTTSSIGAQGAYGRIGSFLEPALKKAQADQVLVIVVSHHYSSGILGAGAAIRKRLNTCPNVVLHMVGHGHKNMVTPRPGSSPQLGYWEVQTCALIDWPQQGRLFELVDNRDGTAELWLTLFDYATDHLPTGPVAAGSRFLSLYEIHKGDKKKAATAEGSIGDRNVILPVSIPAAVQKKLSALPDRPIESKLFG